MLGAIIGDIVGSIYEFNNIKTKDFPLFGPHPNANPNHSTNGYADTDCRFTDDTVLTLAVADWLLDDTSDLAQTLIKYTVKYNNRCYGGMYESWAHSYDPQPYNSYGNGSAMRVSAVGWAATTYDAVMSLAEASAEVTHNHPEGIKGAQAVALAIWLAREGFIAPEIREIISDSFDYDLSETVDEIREWYYFNETCQLTVPQAIICALDATDFEDAIRNAISIGGDSDTVAAITGSIAEAMFGVPDWMKEKAREYLPDELRETLRRFNLALEFSEQSGGAFVSSASSPYSFPDQPKSEPV